MSTHYYMNISLSSSELDYGSVSQYASTTITIYKDKTDYELTMKYNRTSAGSNYAQIAKSDIRSVQATGRYPDGTEFIFSNLTYTFEPPTTGEMAEDRYFLVVKIADDPKLTLNNGNIPCLLKVYGDDNQILGSARFGAVVQSTDGLPFYTHQRYFDMWPGAIPVRLHLNQNDDNIQLRLDATYSKGDVSEFVKNLDGWSRYYSLEGTRPDGLAISIFGTLTKINDYSWYLLFNLSPTFTAVPGEVITQVRIRSTHYYQQKDVNLYSSKLILVIEPTP